MSETTRIRTGAFPTVVTDELSSPEGERVALDSRRPWPLAGRDLVLRVIAGHVDLFAVCVGTDGSEGRRRHLFRVEGGDVILGFSGAVERGATAIIAVGGPGAEVVASAREGIRDAGLLECWLGKISSEAIGPAVDWRMREAEPGTANLAGNEEMRGAARDVLWASCEHGEFRFMGLEPGFARGDPPLPLASGAWIKAAAETSIQVRNEMPTGPELWGAIDRFHVLAMACIRRRLADATESETQRLADRAERAEARTHQLIDDLAQVIVPQSQQRDLSASESRVLSVCRAVGDSMGLAMVQPAGRPLKRGDFEDVREIARASGLRIRRTLLRANWWRWNSGPLIAWYGEPRSPVALIPKSGSYVMLEPGSSGQHVIDERRASEFTADAVMFYPKLPSGALSVRDLLGFCARQLHGHVARIIVSVLSLGVLSLAAPLAIHALVEEVMPRAQFDQLGSLAAALVIVAVAMASLQAMQAVAVLRVEGVLDWKLQAALIDRLLRLPVSFFRQYTVGDLADRTLGVDAIRQAAIARILCGLLTGMFGLFAFVLMLYYSVGLALIAAATAALRVLAIVGIGRLRLHHEQRHAALRGEVEGVVLQLLTAVGKLRVASATVRALAIWAKRFGAQRRHITASQRAANWLTVVEAAFPTVATLILFAATQSDAASKLAANVGAFLAFFAAFGVFMAAVGEWGAAIAGSLVAIPHIVRLAPLLDNAVEESDERKLPGVLSGELELSKITFRYGQGGPPVLDDVSFRVAQGEYVSIVGPSGSGKSTLFRLLLGFERPEAGAVFFDGRALDTLDVSAVRRQIGTVFQDAKLMTGSIYQNICGGMQLPIDEVWEAVRLAGLEADIKAMPMGMHTAISEGVSTISGGQRQRLMIARALIRRPRILLFDEATSALDNRTQSIISASLARLNVTRVVIAHRLSTVQHADRILVLVGGRLVQSGTFAELSSAPGVFAEFARRQLLSSRSEAQS